MIVIKPTLPDNNNKCLTFVDNNDSRYQQLNIDPEELYYNPLTKTLHTYKFSGGIPSLIEGEAIQLATADSSTTIDVNFGKNASVATSINDFDKILLQDGLDLLKTITGANLKSAIRLTARDNLSYGTGANSNTLSLDSTLTNTTCNSGCNCDGNLILFNKLSNGSVSDAEFQKSDDVSSTILRSNMKGVNSDVCPLPTSNLPGSYIKSLRFGIRYY